MKVAFVTGSNKGIGLAIVEKLAQMYGPTQGWDIYLTSRTEKLGMQAVSELASKGMTVKYHQLDITDPESRARFIKFLKDNYPNGINVAINNAGIAFKQAATEPFAEQARVTIHTNFTCTVDFTLEFLPLLAKDARVVHVSSLVSFMTLGKLGDSLYSEFTGPMNLEKLRELIAEFVRLAETSEHEKHGWPSWAYGVSKLGLTKASYIIGEMIKDDPRHIVMNACCPGYVSTDMTSHKGTKTVEQGADTPFYLATLPLGITEPINQFVSERKVLPWSKDTKIGF